MGVIHEKYSSSSVHGYFKDCWSILWGDERIDFTATYANGLEPAPQDLMRINVNYRKDQDHMPVAFEYYPDGRLYSAASFQGQRPVNHDEKDALVDRIIGLLPLIKPRSKRAAFLLNSAMSQARRLPLLQPGQG